MQEPTPPLFGPYVKVGIFAAIALSIAAWSVIQIGKHRYGLGPTNRYTVLLESSHLLGVDSPVEVAGIRVGRIAAIELSPEHDGAIVDIDVQKRVKLFEDASANVYTVGLLGDRYILLHPGDPQKPELPPGATITDTQVPMPFEEMLDNMTPILENLNLVLEEFVAVVQGPEFREGLPSMLAQFESASRRLDQMLASNAPMLQEMLENFTEISENSNASMEEIFASMNASAEETRKLVQEFRTSSVTLTTQLEETATNINEIVASINRGEGTLGTLVRDRETGEEVKTLVTSLSDTLGRVNKIRTIVDYLGTYVVPGSDADGDGSGDGDGFHNQIELRIQPSFDHYYSVGIVNRPTFQRERTRRTVVTDQDGNTQTVTETVIKDADETVFNAQIAKRFWDLTLRGGLIESEGGLGLDYAFWEDQIWLRNEIFDFGRDGDNPFLRNWAELRLFNHLKVAVGVEDTIGTLAGPRFRAGVGLFFDDEDLKLLFSAGAGAAGSF